MEYIYRAGTTGSLFLFGFYFNYAGKFLNMRQLCTSCCPS